MIDLEYLPRLESLSPVKDLEAYHMTILEPDKNQMELQTPTNSIHEKEWQERGNGKDGDYSKQQRGFRYICQVSTYGATNGLLQLTLFENLNFLFNYKSAYDTRKSRRVELFTKHGCNVKLFVKK
ncbi:unnamed protein product [Ceratitis capitata]|uniref:(Mediterranean fruit fly) hypothetical protein n=1 Tax=Ceratitis capitata TaxID=7213 RepID=A0A811UDH7_CERCA|nr:unnamed protein product [Ceratitis capitata]